MKAIEMTEKRKQLFGKDFETFAEAYNNYLQHEKERVEELKKIMSDMKRTTNELMGGL